MNAQSASVEDRQRIERAARELFIVQTEQPDQSFAAKVWDEGRHGSPVKRRYREYACAVLAAGAHEQREDAPRIRREQLVEHFRQMTAIAEPLSTKIAEYHADAFLAAFPFLAAEDASEGEAKAARELVAAIADELTPGRRDKDLIIAARELRERAEKPLDPEKVAEALYENWTDTDVLWDDLTAVDKSRWLSLARALCEAVKRGEFFRSESMSEPRPLRRLRACVEAWTECADGEYNPACCRFPKSCSPTVYDPERVSDEDLEEISEANTQ